MTPSTWRRMASVLCVGAAMATGGCTAFRAYTTPVDTTRDYHLNAKFNASDMRSVTGSVVEEFVGSPWLEGQPQPPVFMIAGIQNRTSDHIDTKNITDRIRTLLLRDGSVRFVNEARREDLLQEQGYQAANVEPATQVAIGRQLGASYMITGALAEMKSESPRQVRVAKQVVRDYKFTLEVTDLETSELVWITHREFARQISKPLIGW